MRNKNHIEIIELVKKIDKLIERGHGAPAAISQLLVKQTDQHVAAVLDIHPESRLVVFRGIAADRQSAVLDIVHGHTLRSIVSHMSDHELAGLIESSPSIVSQKIIHTVERPRLNTLIPMVLDAERQKNLLNFVNYPQRSVGRIMQTEVVVVRDTVTVEQALSEVASFDTLSGPVYQVYVQNDKDEFVGVIPISEILREGRTKKMRDVSYIKKPPSISPLTTQQKAAHLFQEYDLIEAPVISDMHLVGRVLVDDILDIVQQESAEDFQKFAGITDEETLETSVTQSSRRRLPWMIANIFLDLMAVSIIMPFEETIAAVTALAVIMPIISDMGGNVGIQSLSVSVRALAANRPDWKLMGRELFKEIRVGVLNGAILGVIIAIVAFVMWQNPFLGLVVMIALFFNTILASVIGGVLPIILRRLRKDPAMMSGAILTTITDFFGFLIFLGMARLFIDYLA
jgi:magnesium transporter